MLELTELQSKAWEVLKASKVGSEITSNQVKDIIGLHTRKSGDFRAIIHALRVKGYCVCANTSGYYTARNQKEIDEYCLSLSGRITEMSEALAGLRSAKPVF